MLSTEAAASSRSESRPPEPPRRIRHGDEDASSLRPLKKRSTKDLRKKKNENWSWTRASPLRRALKVRRDSRQQYVRALGREKKKKKEKTKKRSWTRNENPLKFRKD